MILEQLTTLGLVALGGAAGAIVRFGLVHAVATVRGLPVSILAANALGSLALGVLIVVASEPTFVLLGVGFCGGLTTVSTWAIDTVVLGRDGLTRVAVVNVVANVVMSVAALALGMSLAGAFAS